MPKDGKVNPTLVPGEGLPFEKLTTAAPESGSTTHVSVIDEFGNMVSTTHTIGGYFGSCIVAPGTGFPLNAHLSNQKLDIAEKDNPNFVQGGLRVMSTMCPTLVVKDGEPIMAIGSPGSWCIPPAIVQILNAVLLFDMDLQQAINEPRAIFTSYSAPLKVYAEPRLPEETIQALIDAGYEVDSERTGTPAWAVWAWSWWTRTTALSMRAEITAGSTSHWPIEKASAYRYQKV